MLRKIEVEEMNELQFSDPGFDYTHQDDLVFLSQTMDERGLIYLRLSQCNSYFLTVDILRYTHLVCILSDCLTVFYSINNN